MISFRPGNTCKELFGIVTSSAGNHAQGVGFAATRFNIPGRIYVPEIIPRNKLEAIQRYRVEVVIEGKLYDEAHAAALADAKKTGRVYTTFPSKETIAEGLEGGISEITFELGQRLIDRMVLVEEDEIRSAIRFLLAHHRLVVEGSGAVGVAALIHNRWSNPGRKVGVVLSGGNLDYQLLKEIVAEEA
jgi:threonine dehydratase